MTPELERMAKLLDAGVTPPEDACRELAAHLRRLAVLMEALGRIDRHVVELGAEWARDLARMALRSYQEPAEAEEGS